MASEDLRTLDGQPDDILPDGRFAARLENTHRIIAYTPGRMRKFRIRSVVGGRIRVGITPDKLAKGRIVFRDRGSSASLTGQRGGRR